MATTLEARTFIAFIIEAGVISALVAFLLNRFGQKLDRRENVRVNESYIIMKMLKALGHLCEATAIAQQEGRCNGEMKTAIAYYTETKDSLNEYILQRSSERTHAR